MAYVQVVRYIHYFVKSARVFVCTEEKVIITNDTIFSIAIFLLFLLCHETILFVMGNVLH